MSENSQTIQRPWSERVLAFWGKSHPPIPVVTHLEDSAFVAGILWDKYLSPHTKTYLSLKLGANEDDVKDLLIWITSIHDIGKMTPDFQVKDDSLASALHDFGINPKASTDVFYKQRAHHATTGQFIVEEFLSKESLPLQWADVVGAHHGRGQSETTTIKRQVRQKSYSAYRDKLLGSGAWDDSREEVLLEFWNRSRMHENTAILTTPESMTTMMITGFVIFADWVASSIDNFDEEYLHDREQRNQKAISRITIPDAWHPQSEPSFLDRFGFNPYDSQVQIAQMMEEETRPGLWIIESSMGTGKTESALLGAEILAQKHGMHGLVFALPNRASTNAIFSRFVAWMDSLPEDDLSLTASVNLLHGKSNLNDAFLKVTGNSGVDVDSSESKPNRAISRFFQNPKTRPLTPMLVSTVDHVLMAGTDAKHQMLRHIGFAGKVIVVDEVHAYDAYMSTYLEAALRAFGAYRIPIILLSATLPPERRKELVEAYSGSSDDSVAAAEGYPLVTYASHDGKVRIESFPSPREGTPYIVTHCNNDTREVLSKAKEVTDRGGNVLVIRNTVRRAIETYQAAKDSIGENTLLLHSRFLPIDRESIEQNLISKFGTKVKEREKGWVVVATQVAEQSLDVDFDLLITDLAPTDLVLQRIGRVFRNPLRTDRAVDQAEVCVIDLSLDDKYELLPYDSWAMSQASWVFSQVETVTTPDDVPVLVRKAYEEDQYPELKRERESKDQSSRHSAGAGALDVFSKDRILGIGLNDRDENSVRDIKDTQEVVVLEDIDGEVCFPSWLPQELNPGKKVPSIMRKSDRKAVGACTISLRENFKRRYKIELQQCPEWRELAYLKDLSVLLLSKEEGKEWSHHGRIGYSLEEGLR